LYIDSNIFIFAATDKTKLGENCRKIISLISEKKLSCASSLLILDEVMWILKKKTDRKSAIKIAKTILSLPIKWIDVDKKVIIKMVDIFEDSKLSPRDAIHLSSMKQVGLSVILSQDADFDKVEGLQRVNVKKYFEKNNYT
jgi:hypothetical protein